VFGVKKSLGKNKIMVYLPSKRTMELAHKQHLSRKEKAELKRRIEFDMPLKDKPKTLLREISNSKSSNRKYYDSCMDSVLLLVFLLILATFIWHF
jgi:hypothetical protein